MPQCTQVEARVQKGVRIHSPSLSPPPPPSSPPSPSSPSYSTPPSPPPPPLPE